MTDPAGSSSQSSEIRRLATFLEVSQALSGTLNLKVALHQVLEVLEQHHGVIRGTVTLLDEETDELYIEASNGLTAKGQQTRYHLGEGITGRAVQTGKPIVIPQLSLEPMFLNRAGQRKEKEQRELSFICVPILRESEGGRRTRGRSGLQTRPGLRERAEIRARGRLYDRPGDQGPPPHRSREAAPR